MKYFLFFYSLVILGKVLEYLYNVGNLLSQLQLNSSFRKYSSLQRNCASLLNLMFIRREGRCSPEYKNGILAIPEL